MTDITNTPPPPPPPPQGQPDPAQQEPGLREELAKARSRNKLLVTVSVVLGTIFVLLAGVGYIVYTKISAAKENFEEVVSAMQAFPPPGAGYQPEVAGQAPYGQASSTSMPSSSLGLFSGGLPGAVPGMGGIDPAQAQRAAKALQKYADRPIVKEFMEDLKKNPGTAKALELTDSGNPLAVFAAVQNSPGMDKLAMKYATRPEFLALMMEAMSDPEMQPLLKGMHGMGLPGLPAQQEARPVSTLPPPSSVGGGAYPSGGTITLDPSAISGPARPAPGASRKAPPPVDTD